MKFEQNLSMLFEDLNIPEIFITEYFCNANGDYVKMYLYMLFLCKYNSEISALDLSKKLSIPIKSVEAGLKYWEEQGVIIKKNKTYELADLKTVILNKLYTPKLTSSPADAIENMDRNVRRSQAIEEINQTFFQGVMSSNWCTTFDNLFQKYAFDEDVMIALCRYCFDRQALYPKYLQAVAEGWHQSKIHTMNDLEKYYLETDHLNQIKNTIKKKLKIYKNFNEYEEAFIEKWVNDYNYPMNVIEIALKKTTSKSSVSFDYLDTLITDWHDKKLTTPDEINEYLKDMKQKEKKAKALVNKNRDQIPMTTFFGDDGQYSNIDEFYTNL